MLKERITQRRPLGFFGGGGNQIDFPIGGNGSRIKMKVGTVERSGIFHVPFSIVGLLVGDHLPFHLFELALGGCRVILDRSGVRLDLHINVGREAICCWQECLDKFPNGALSYLEPPAFPSGGGGMVSTAHDYLRFCAMMLNGGTLDGVQILSPKTVALFSLNHLPDNKELADMAPPGNFSESGYSGIGFSIGCGVNIDVAKTRLPGTLGEFFWGGAAATAFWIDPKEELAVVFMTQVIGSEVRLTLTKTGDEWRVAQVLV